MSTCDIRYRFDGPGPASFLVEHGGMLRIYCRGALSAPLPEEQVRAILGDEKRSWVPASGTLMIETESKGWPGAPALMGVDPDESVVETA